jgi:hypothetical protein
MGVDPAVLRSVVAHRDGGPQQDRPLARTFMSPLLAQPELADLFREHRIGSVGSAQVTQTYV